MMPAGTPAVKPAEPTQTPPDPIGYKGQTGYYQDIETGLVLCTWRYYDPTRGRWLTRDPIGYGGGLNLYGYCGGDAVGGVDALGLLLALDSASANPEIAAMAAADVPTAGYNTWGTIRGGAQLANKFAKAADQVTKVKTAWDLAQGAGNQLGPMLLPPPGGGGKRGDDDDRAQRPDAAFGLAPTHVFADQVSAATGHPTLDVFRFPFGPDDDVSSSEAMYTTMMSNCRVIQFDVRAPFDRDRAMREGPRGPEDGNHTNYEYWLARTRFRYKLNEWGDRSLHRLAQELGGYMF